MAAIINGADRGRPGRWIVDFRDHTGRRRWITCLSREEAKARLSEVLKIQPHRARASVSADITCSAYVEDGATVAQIQTIGRSNDPIYELGFRLVGAREQEKIWTYVLESLAAHYGVRGSVDLRKTCVDSRIQWSQAGNVWRNATIRSMLYSMAAPLRRGHGRGQQEHDNVQ